MLVVIVGLAGAAIFGTADFFGGLASKRVAPVRVVAMSSLVGLTLLVVASLLLPGRFSAGAALWGGLSGLVGAFAILALYAALAIGPMSILSPLTAVLSAIVPAVWGIAHGDRFSVLGYIALGLALVAVVLVGFVPEKGAVRPSLRGLAYAVVAGTLIGVLLILLNQAPDDSGVYPLIFNRLSYVVLLWTIVLGLILRRRVRREPAAAPLRPALPLIAAAGVADSLANILILTGLRLGDLSVMAVLGALYPAGTIALAAIVLRERIAPVQWAGLVLALTAAAMLALA